MKEKEECSTYLSNSTVACHDTLQVVVVVVCMVSIRHPSFAGCRQTQSDAMKAAAGHVEGCRAMTNLDRLDPGSSHGGMGSKRMDAGVIFGWCEV